MRVSGIVRLDEMSTDTKLIKIRWIVICSLMLFLTIHTAIATDIFCGNSSQTLFAVVQYSNGTLATNSTVTYQLWNNSLINASNMGNGYYNITITTPAYGTTNSYLYNLSSSNPNASMYDQLYVTACGSVYYNMSVQFSITPTSPIYYGTLTNASCNGDLFRNNVNVTNAENNYYTTLPIGIHAYSCQVPANSTWGSSIYNTTYEVLAVPNGDGGSSPPPIACTYNTTDPNYVGDTVTITFSCPSNLNQQYTLTWTDDKGAIYQTETGQIQVQDTRSYKPIAAMNGIVTVSVYGTQLIKDTFVVKSTMMKQVGYIYMVLLGVAILILIYYLNMFLNYERNGKRLSARDKIITVFCGVGLLVGLGFYLSTTSQIGYLYMGLLAIGILVLLYILNGLLSGGKRNGNY
jgi:hypothetical protein